MKIELWMDREEGWRFRDRMLKGAEVRMDGRTYPETQMIEDLELEILIWVGDRLSSDQDRVV